MLRRWHRLIGQDKADRRRAAPALGIAAKATASLRGELWPGDRHGLMSPPEKTLYKPLILMGTQPARGGCLSVETLQGGFVVQRDGSPVGRQLNDALPLKMREGA